MEDLSDIRSLPLFSLTSTTRTLLSNLLDSTKVLPTKGPIRRHRDWRGLASLVNISTEVEANIWNYNDKTGKVIEIWMQSGAGLVGELLDHLVVLDRFDVYDDLILSIKEQQTVRPANQVVLAQNNIQIDDSEIITFEDRPGHRHEYHALVLYAEADMQFVMEMKRILSSHGFEICIKDNLLPGYASQYPPIAKLISERCHRVVLVYSPEFLLSNDNTFFRDYAHAESINLNTRMLLPIMYRQCVLPKHLRIYHMLYFNSDNFWERLVKTMQLTKYPRVNAGAPLPFPPPPPAPVQAANSTSSSYSAVRIVTATDSEESDSRYFLPYSAPVGSLTPSSVSPAPVGSLTPSTGSDCQSLAPLSTNTEDVLIAPTKKKRGFVRRCMNAIAGKKNKKKVVNTMLSC